MAVADLGYHDTHMWCTHSFFPSSSLGDPCDPGLVRLTLDVRECGEAMYTLTKVGQFGPDGNKFILALGFCLTYTNEVFPF